MNNLKKLMYEFGYLSEDTNTSDLNQQIEDEVSGKISKSQKLDQVDTVTFGLETDDGLVVKVYIDTKDADKFEKAIAEMLGEVDDIEEALNRLEKDINIVDVEWPKKPEDEEDEENNEDDGSEILDKKVYAKKNLNKEVKEHHLNYGQKLTHDIIQEAGSQSLSALLQTISQQLVYESIINLGIPELALERSPYKTQILKGIRATALEIQKNPAMKTALKTFVKLQISDDSKNKAENQEKEDKKQVKESIDDETSPIGQYFTALRGIITLFDPNSEKNISQSILTSQKFKSLEMRSAINLRSKINGTIRMKLKKVNDLLQKEDIAFSQVNETLMYDDIEPLITKMVQLCDNKDQNIANYIIGSQAFKKLIYSARQGFSKTSSQIRYAIEQFKNVLMSLTEEEEKVAPIDDSATLDASESSNSFESEGDSLKVTYQNGSFNLSGEHLERAMKSLNNKQTLSIQTDAGKFIVISPRGSSAQIKLVGTDTKITLTPPDISAFLDASEQLMSGTPEEKNETKEESTDKEEKV